MMSLNDTNGTLVAYLTGDLAYNLSQINIYYNINLCLFCNNE